jgi:hypothetical protein
MLRKFELGEVLRTFPGRLERIRLQPCALGLFLSISFLNSGVTRSASANRRVTFLLVRVHGVLRGTSGAFFQRCSFSLVLAAM